MAITRHRIITYMSRSVDWEIKSSSHTTANSLKRRKSRCRRWSPAHASIHPSDPQDPSDSILFWPWLITYTYLLTYSQRKQSAFIEVSGTFPASLPSSISLASLCLEVGRRGSPAEQVNEEEEDLDHYFIHQEQGRKREKKMNAAANYFGDNRTHHIIRIINLRSAIRTLRSNVVYAASPSFLIIVISFIWIFRIRNNNSSSSYL